MAFDLEPSKVNELRGKYAGRMPEPERLVELTSMIQDEYIKRDSAAIGGLTTLKGVQSTRTRRPISASIDLIVDGADISYLGDNHDSWQHNKAYFADVEDIEVGILDINEFELFNFPEAAVEDSYSAEFEEQEFRVAQPESNIASKFNRAASNPEGCKFSDYVDLNSHLHWYSENHGEIGELLEFAEAQVNYDLNPVFDQLETTDANFNNGELEILKDVYDEAQLFFER